MRRAALVVLLTALVLGGYGLALNSRPATPAPPTSTSRPLVDDHPLPTVTPGVTLPGVTVAQVCTPGWASQHRHGLTAAQKQQVLKAYGERANQPVAEWDHLIPLELGGGNGTRNIWPQLSPDDMRRKDHFEDRLHRQVCAGQLDLAAAQAQATSFWEHW